MFFRGYGTTCLPEVAALLLKLAIDTVFDNDSNDLCGSWLPINLTFVVAGHNVFLEKLKVYWQMAYWMQ